MSDNAKTMGFSLLALVIITLSLFPFWIFGEYSALGYYDEVDAIIPWNYLRVIHSSASFIHQSAGGIVVNLGLANDKIDLYRTLIEFFPLWIANLLMRGVGFFFYFLGIFLITKHLYHAKSWVAFTLSFFALYASYIPYGWTMGGMGWDLTNAIWICVVLFLPLSSPSMRFLLSSLVAGMIAITSSPIFLSVLGFFLVLLVAVSLKSDLSLRLTRRKLSTYQTEIFFISLLLLFLAVNWYDQIYYLSKGSESFSARFLEILTLKSITELSTVEQLIKTYDQFISGLRAFSSPILVVGFAIVLFETAITKKIKPILLILLTVLVPFILTTVKNSIPIGFVRSYHFDMIWLLLPIVTAFAIADLSVMGNNNRFRRYRHITYAVILTASAVMGIKKLSDYAIKAMDGSGGLAASFCYPELKSFKNEPYRLISDHCAFQPATPIFYDLQMFDGALAASPYQRNYFIAYAMNQIPTETLHHSKHFFYFDKIDNGYNMRAFEIANIRYIITDQSSTLPDAKQIVHHRAIKVSDWNGSEWIKKLFLHLYGDRYLAKELYVYELTNPWQRVFSPEHIIFSDANVSEKKFYQELLEIKHQDALISKHDLGPQTLQTHHKLTVKNFRLTSEGIHVSVDKGGGYLVYNEVYLPYWEASCKSEKLPVISMNGIMMGTFIPEKCNEIDFTIKKN